MSWLMLVVRFLACAWLSLVSAGIVAGAVYVAACLFRSAIGGDGGAVFILGLAATLASVCVLACDNSE